jgi:hypothetical protein
MDRRLRRILIALAVLLGLLVAADRISLAVAEGVAAQTIKESQHLASTPSVSVHGFPFLTQLISGNYDDIDVTAHGVEVGGSVRPLRISTVAVALRSVTIGNNFKSVRAARASATATITYTDLSSTLGATISYLGGGRVEAAATVTVGGVPISGRISALVQIAQSELTFTQVHTAVAGLPLPSALSAVLGQVFAVPLSLAGLPFGLQYTGIDATKSGIKLRLTGQDLVYYRG